VRQAAAVGLAIALGTALTASWLRSPKLALTAGAMMASTALVSVIARGDVAVALQLAAFGILLWHASIATTEQ
jgi:multisubunit Na+/H+ antiporter MnhB subunit